jgi:tetratricopeptide (TPR) repeat protein
VIRDALVVVSASVALGCAGRAAPPPVSPGEIPELEQRLAADPADGAVLLRYAAALFAAGRCDTASIVAARGWARRPGDATAPLVIGQCAERDGRHDAAVQTYRQFLAAYPAGPGTAAVRAREMLALRAGATARARDALAREQELAAAEPNPEAVAVLPLEIAGDSSYRPLSRGLAQMLTSDLALLRRFPLVERLQIGALLDELALAETGRVDPGTAARIGHLIQAGQLVQGLAAIPPDQQVRLEAGIVRATGETSDPAVTSGRFADLLRLEKALVLIIAQRLGYVLSEAERRAVLENGTQNLVAFLAYSRGLLEEDRGNFAAAAAHYAEAARVDPSFREARERYQAAAAAPAVQQLSAAQLLSAASLSVPDPVPEPTELALTPTSSAVGTVLGELGSTLAEQTAPEGIEQTTQQVATTPISQPPPTTVQIPGGLQGTIRIIIRIP